jgi:hypothetical protein
MEWNGKLFRTTDFFDRNWCYDYLRGIQYLWTGGNFGCDCNRSRFAQSAGLDCPDLDCGETEIELLMLTASDEAGREMDLLQTLDATADEMFVHWGVFVP